MFSLDRIRTAWSAFRTIASGKEYMYADYKYTSFLGNTKDISFFRDKVTEHFNDQVYQMRLIDQAKEILK